MVPPLDSMDGTQVCSQNFSPHSSPSPSFFLAKKAYPKLQHGEKNLEALTFFPRHKALDVFFSKKNGHCSKHNNANDFICQQLSI